MSLKGISTEFLFHTLYKFFGLTWYWLVSFLPEKKPQENVNKICFIVNMKTIVLESHRPFCLEHLGVADISRDKIYKFTQKRR